MVGGGRVERSGRQPAAVNEPITHKAQQRNGAQRRKRAQRLGRVFLIAALLSIALALTGCGGPGGSGGREEITVFAAASLSEAFRELAGVFEADNPGVSVALNLDGSQRLRSQLEFGAGADVFISADLAQMRRAVEAGLVSGNPAAFASSRMAVIWRIGGDADAAPELSNLARPGTRLAVAHPGVPAGAYARQLLDNLAADGRYGPEFARQAAANIVSEETNVRNVQQKVVLGQADAGIVYRAMAQKSAAAGEITPIPIPDELNLRAHYYAASLQAAPQPTRAAQFVNFLNSEPAQRIMQQHGFEPPVGPAAQGE